MESYAMRLARYEEAVSGYAVAAAGEVTPVRLRTCDMYARRAADAALILAAHHKLVDDPGSVAYRGWDAASNRWEEVSTNKRRVLAKFAAIEGFTCGN